MALFTAALCVLVEALLHGQTSLLHLGLGLSVAAALLAAFAVQQRRRAAPIFDAAVFFTRPMVGIAALLAAVSIGYWAVLVFLPPLLLAWFGWTSDGIETAMLATTVPMLVVPLLGARLVERLGWRNFFAAALAIMALGNAILVLALFSYSAAPPIWLALAGMIAIGTSAALAHPQLTAAVVALVPTNQAGMASAMTVVMRQGAFAVGIAILGSMLAKPDQAIGYMASLTAAAIASALGVVAALLLLARRSARDAR